MAAQRQVLSVLADTTMTFFVLSTTANSQVGRGFA